MKKDSILNMIKKYNTYIILIICILACIVVSPDFLTLTNIINIVKQYAGLTVIALGMLFVIMTGGIDLSVGSYVALGSVTVAIFLTKGMSVPIAVLLTLCIGVLGGTFTGILVAKIKMPPFIVTMAMMTVIKGIAFMLSNGSPIKTPLNTIGILGKGKIGVIPYLVILAVIVVLISAFIIRNTSFGRIIMAIGSNEKCVLLSGIQVPYYKIAAYIISAVCAVLGGIMAASRTAVGTPLYGTGLELDAIAACVIGGASLNGGEGSAIKTVVGVLILALIGNIMNLLSVPSYPQDVIKGAIIIISILIQIFTSERKKTV
ncbi:ABC transporter permease [Anaerosacchariphilus polymeriproducens]|uniref:ABC transporter permease n=1 Tax=Anaerosacchariphilus polymeriproducens TaxID=1812858 RepID=A0A371B076_9FIRM|nr:ABC transporter permease [Anaerosacchariphilus polymeriproducens]RDU25254.1 ABC transporter permease [Anaerosacchariphilus polymeriproducens]